MILPLDAAGLSRVASALRATDAVVIPFPTPLPYVVGATTARAVNEAKGRPADQACGLLVGDLGDVAPYLALDRETLAFAGWLAQVERVNLLVPVGRRAPRWLAGAAVDGLAGITLAWLGQLRPLADEFGHLFVSSGNLTRGRVAVTATEADAVFAGRRLVLDGDPFRDPAASHGSATMIEVRPSGALRVVRDGINNRSFAGDSAAYLEDLRDRFGADRRN